MEIVTFNNTGSVATLISTQLPYRIKIRYKTTALFKVKLTGFLISEIELNNPFATNNIDDEGYIVFISHEINKPYSPRYPTTPTFISFCSTETLPYAFSIFYEVIIVSADN